MNLYIVIGHTGEGKSSFIKRMIQGRNCYIFDVNNEYKELEANPNAPRGRHIDGDFTGFAAEVLNRRRSNVVFEEATGFLYGSIGKIVSKIIINKRHTENNYFFLFHSINSVPPRIGEIANYVVLFRTADNRDNVKRKFPNLLPAFDKLKNSPKHSVEIIKNI